MPMLALVCSCLSNFVFIGLWVYAQHKRRCAEIDAETWEWLAERRKEDRQRYHAEWMLERRLLSEANERIKYLQDWING
jgi:hypothetical protein